MWNPFKTMVSMVNIGSNELKKDAYYSKKLKSQGGDSVEPMVDYGFHGQYWQ